MRTTTRQANGVAILNITGNIIGQTVPQVRRAILTQIDSNETPRILINFKGVHKMDSGGLGTPMSAYKMARAKNGRIGIINVGKNINNLIVKSRLINIFEHFNTEDAAISEMARSFENGHNIKES